MRKTSISEQPAKSIPHLGGLTSGITGREIFLGRPLKPLSRGQVKSRSTPSIQNRAIRAHLTIFLMIFKLASKFQSRSPRGLFLTLVLLADKIKIFAAISKVGRGQPPRGGGMDLPQK